MSMGFAYLAQEPVWVLGSCELDLGFSLMYMDLGLHGFCWTGSMCVCGCSALDSVCRWSSCQSSKEPQGRRGSGCPLVIAED